MAALELINTTLFNDPNLEAYYRFETGALTLDSSGKGRTLTNIGGCTEAAGQFSGCVDLGSANTTKYLRIDNTLGITNQNAWSISIWSKASNTIADNEQNIIFNYINNGYGDFYPRYYRSGADVSWNMLRNNGLTQESDALASVPGTTWHNLVVTVATTSMKWYVDGADQGTTTVSTTQRSDAYSATSALVIGNGGIADLSRFFKGYFDDCAIFSRVLSAAEVTANYNGTNMRVVNKLYKSGQAVKRASHY